MDIKDMKLFLLDMDGTIYLGDRLFDSVLKFLQFIKKSGKKYVFLTNNSSKSVSAYIEKLERLGIKSDKDDFLTSVDALIPYLKSKRYKKIYTFGTRSFREQLTESGLNTVTDISDGIDCLCMGFDTELTFKKLEDACILLNKNVDFVATNPDWVCPTETGFVPDCGSISAMLSKITGKTPIFIGKPAPKMPELAMKKFGFSKEETVIIGDRLYTDIKCGINADINTAFVLSGEGTLGDIEKYGITPKFIYKNIKEIYEITSQKSTRVFSE